MQDFPARELTHEHLVAVRAGNVAALVTCRDLPARHAVGAGGTGGAGVGFGNGTVGGSGWG